MDLIYFLIGVLVSLFIALSVIFALSRSLGSILAELCGTRERGSFWVNFINLLVVLSSIMLALYPTEKAHQYGASSIDHFWGIIVQVRNSIGGIILALIIIAIVIGNSISLFERKKRERGEG